MQSLLCFKFSKLKTQGNSHVPGDGNTYNPILVKVEGHGYGVGPWHYSPNKLEVHVWAHDVELDTYADWFHLYDYNILTDTYGTTLQIEGHADVSGGYGESPGYSIGGSLGISWTETATEIFDQGFTKNEYHAGLYQHLGSVMVDVSEGSGTNFVRYAVGLQLSIPNLYAPSVDFHRYTFKVVVTLTWSLWYYIFLWSGSGASQTQTFYVGDGTPSTDATIYLLIAQDFEVSQP